MVQVQSIQHVNTEQIIEDLRKIGILVTELKVDIGVDRVTSVIVNGHYIGYCAGNVYDTVTNISTK
jgi:hypothetical protein